MEIVPWPHDFNNGDIEEESSFGGGGREKVDVRNCLFCHCLSFANDIPSSLTGDRSTTCTYDCTSREESCES